MSDGWPGNWPEVRVIFDEYCPVDTAYLVNNGFMVMATQMSKRVWWKPWTWRRHVLSVEELFPMVDCPDFVEARFHSYSELTWGRGDARIAHISTELHDEYPEWDDGIKGGEG